eukprot:6185110-Pleurochrysis_carterae.AAC.2
MKNRPHHGTDIEQIDDRRSQTGIRYGYMFQARYPHLASADEFLSAGPASGAPVQDTKLASSFERTRGRRSAARRPRLPWQRSDEHSSRTSSRILYERRLAIHLQREIVAHNATCC